MYCLCNEWCFFYLGLPPLHRFTEYEECSDRMSEYDSRIYKSEGRPHAAFADKYRFSHFC